MQDGRSVAQQFRRSTREAPVCRFSSDSTDPFVSYVLELVSDFSGVRFEVVSGHRQQHVDIYYGNDRNVNSTIRISEACYTLDNIPSVPTAGDFACARSQAPFPFDLFRAVRFWLTDAGNDIADTNAFDQHERLLTAFSAQEKLGIREVPIVNAYLMLLRSYIEERLGTRTQDRLLGGHRCIVVLSHDVENPMANDYLHKLWLAGVALLNDRPRGFAAEIRNAFLRGSSKDRPPQFGEITDAEEEVGFRSTFFFSAVSNCEGHPLDNSYDVRAPYFRTVMQRLTERGWEVGVHLSYNARRSAAQIAAERERIEHVGGCKVLGSRHHYWHMSRPIWRTLEDHEKAGLAYDASLAFNERPGYRLGIAYPFYPWSPVSQRPVRTLQIPTACMDGSFFYDPSLTVDGFIEHFGTLLESLKRFNGVACVDWHEYTSVRTGTTFKKWGEAYLELLKLLASDHSVAVCSCAELLQAMNQKEELADSHVV